MKYDGKFSDEVPAAKGGKGFYIALAVCLVAVCGVAVATFVGGFSDTPAPITDTQPSAVTTKPSEQQVVIPATDVKDNRTTVVATVRTTIRTTARTTLATTKASADLFVFPVSNRVIQVYSDTPVYSETLGEWTTHNGVDFAAGKGESVKVPADGTVKRIYKDSLWGDAIEIDHGGNVVSRCYGVKAQNIKEGQAVKAGAVMGTVSEIPAEIVGESHIHVEVLANNKYVNPLLLIRGDVVTAVPTTATTIAAATTTTTKK